ncbi:copper-containing nitrite reductase [Amaricoccus sp. W119]|uniref:copper-containing nitrite reductase n=1 Tax=Amaricoccus sp. W119 TaxID=3391833 RepID=UPI0039A6609B
MSLSKYARLPGAGHAPFRRFALCLLILCAVAVGSLAAMHAALAQEHQHGAGTEVAQAAGESGQAATEGASEASNEGATGGATEDATEGATPAAASPDVSYHAPLSFTLRTGIAEGRMVYIGVGGTIDKQVNPTLTVHEGELVQIILINGEGAEHDIFVDQYGARSSLVIGKNASSTFSFRATSPGEFAYYCTIAGHRAAGMEGLIRVVGGERTAEGEDGADIVRDPADLPDPIGQRAPQVVKVELETVELKGRLDDGTSYEFWTFDGKVPGPLVRVRVGDTVEVTLKNHANSVMMHSVDFHAATGPGGGAHATQTEPGGATVVTFKALKPGVYVYHCATPSVAHHITNGMYGLIVVEPEGGLPQVDREFYVMQGEIYTVEPYGTRGLMEMDYDKLISENPEYFIFNGSVGALTKEHPLYANPGERVRVFFGVGGPNFTSSFHVIGEIFDNVYPLASITSPPLTNVQTVSVPPGGATVVDFTIDRAGTFVLVDHALSRAERGLAGYLIVDGPEDDEIMHASPADQAPGRNPE